MLYDLLTDPRPTEQRPRETLNNPFDMPPPARGLNARVPEALSDLVESMLSRDPARRPVDTDALGRELAELLADPGADYQAPAHPPSEQRQPEPPNVSEPGEEGAGRWSKLRALRGRTAAGVRRSGKVLAGGAVAAVVLAAAAILWMQPGAPTIPSAAPSPPLVMAPPDMSPAPEPLREREPAHVPKQEEVPTVKTQPPEAPKEARSPRDRGPKSPPSADVCKGLTLAAAIAAGCTGVPVRPDPFTCPEGAQRAMRAQLGWGESERFSVVMDDRYDPWGKVWLRAGDTVVGVVPQGISPGRQPEVAPPGTQFLGGKVYVVPEKTASGWPGSVIVKYERVKLPNREELPACFIVETTADELKDGAAKTDNRTSGKSVDYWP